MTLFLFISLSYMTELSIFPNSILGSHKIEWCKGHILLGTQIFFIFVYDHDHHREQKERERQQKLEQEKEEKRRRQQEEEKKRREEEEKRKKAEKEKAEKEKAARKVHDFVTQIKCHCRLSQIS